MKIFRVTLVACLFALSGAFSDVYADVSQDFDDWTPLTAPGDQTQDGWILEEGMIRGEDFSSGTAGAAWLINTSQGWPDSNVSTPLLPNGVGTVSFETASKHGSALTIYVHSATNAAGPWTQTATFTSTAAEMVYQRWTNVVDVYAGSYIRISKALSGSGAYLGLDNIHVTDPPAKVDLGTPYTEPGAPEVGQSVHVFCTIAPSALATITSTKLAYEIGGVYTTNTMANITNNLYRTITPIPAQPTAGVTVNYDVIVTLTGTNAITPATASSFYTVTAPPFESDYNLMEVTGDSVSTMTIVSNGLWRGIVNVPSPLSNAGFQFRGTHTNGITTNVWGDATPDSTALVARGTAGIYEDAFTVDAMPAGNYAFFFNENDESYTVNSADFDDFNGWGAGAETQGNHATNGWVVNDGWVKADPPRMHSAKACYLSDNGGAYVRTPELMNGVGQISFWMRHWATNAPSATECHVQVSETGGTNLTEWTTISTIPVAATAFNRYVIPHNNRYDRYVRIQNTTEDPKAKIAIDEFLVAGAGAGVTMSNLTHTPASPTDTESVSISVDTTTHRGAEITGVTTYWRTGNSGGFLARSMDQSSGNTWTTRSDIPAGEGDDPDGLGAGTVEYYVQVAYSGYESSEGSPTTIPRAGSAGATSYVVQAAQIIYSNVVHTPLAPEVNTSFTVEADIIPVAGAHGSIAELLYRTGGSGPFQSIVMTNAGTHYVTQGTIPVPSYPGTPVQYYISTSFDGPSADSPATYPAGGSSAPVTVLSRAATPTSDYTTMVVEGDFNGALRLHADHQWVGVGTVGDTNNPVFRFKGTSATATNTWGDDAPITNTLPIFGTAAVGESDIQLSGTYSNDFVFHFNASNGEYRVHSCHHEDYNGFAPISSPVSTPTTSSNGWSVLAATVFESDEAFDGRSVGLGGSVTDSWSYARSPIVDGGIGNISFWYRNLDDTGLVPGTLSVEVRENGGDWVAIETITNILSPDYIFHETGFALPGDDIDVQLVWNNSDNPDDATIAVDDLTIEHLGAYLALSNLAHLPASPSVADQVTVDVNAASMNFATNLSGKVWYRMGTNGSFTSTDMTETAPGHLESAPPIPRGEAGIVQYYVEAAFTDPLGTHTLYAYEPTDGADGPASYTNIDEFAAVTYVEASEGWPVLNGPPGFRTNTAGWAVNDGLIRKEDYDGGAVGAIWLLNSDSGVNSYTNSYLQTPALPHGAGILRFEAHNRNIASLEFLLQSSTNGIDNWQTIRSYTNLTDGIWNSYTLELNIESPLYLRFFQSEETGSSQFLGLDNIIISYPQARVAISNVAFAPFYPADSESVTISCEIATVSTNVPAMDITARVYHKRSSEGSYTNPPIKMTRSGNAFTTSSPIPPYNAGDTVDYYIESTFNGYQSFISYSPTYSPAAAPDAARHSYDVRAHASRYSGFQIGTPQGETDMKQLSDNSWQAIVYFETPATDPTISLDGLYFCDGTNIIPDVSWGDANQSRTNLPYAGQMQPNSSSIFIGGEVVDQYVVTFNELTGEYTVRRAVYQDFNHWPASDSYFEASSGGTRFIGFYTDFQNPTDWPLSTESTTGENFDSSLDWDPITNYPPQVAYSDLITGRDEAEDFAIVKGLVIPQLSGASENAAALLHHEAGADGAVRMNVLYTEGAGTIDFDIRCVDNKLAASTYGGSGTFTNFTNIRVEASIQASAIPANDSKDTCGQCYVSILGRYVDPDNYYELRMVQRKSAQEGYYRRLEIWKRKGGILTRLGEYGTLGGTLITEARTISLLIYTQGGTVRLKAFDGSNPDALITATDDSSPIASGGIGVTGMDADIVVNQVRVFNAPDEDYSNASTLYYEDFGSDSAPDWDPGSAPWSASNGRYVRPGYTGDPLEFKIDYTEDNPALATGWNTLAIYTNFTNTAFVSVSHEINRPEDMFLRIRHTGGTGNLVVDNISLNDWHGDNLESDWKATAAWVTDNSYPTGDTGARSNVLELVNSRAYDIEYQYIRSPWLTNGAYVVEFDYVSTTGTNDSLVFSIDHTMNGDTASWATDITVTNNPAQWTHFAHTMSVHTNPFPMYVRIKNVSTDHDAGIAIDNFSVTPPIPLQKNMWRGYNALVTSTETNKRLPEPGNLKGAYLNNSPTNDTLDAAVFDADLPYIETAELRDGLGEISFWYRAWDTNATSIDIMTSTNRFDDEWTLLHTIDNITNQTFQEFNLGLYDRDCRFLRLQCSTDPGAGRVCIDNVLVAAPIASGLSLRNMELTPDIPLVGTEVFIKAEVYDRFLNPSNITLEVVYRVGDHDWGAYSAPGVQTNSMHRSPTGDIYETSIPLVPNGSSADTVIQYYVQARFDGFQSEVSSPVIHKHFRPPEHYWPVDLNSGQTTTTPYYITFSSLPGQVWINEVDVYNRFDDTPRQFVEICGVKGTDIGGWQVRVLDTDYSTNTTYALPSSTILPNATNQYGFYILGSDGVPEAQTTLSATLPTEGGIQLLRERGVIAHGVCWDTGYHGDGKLMTNDPSYRLVYIGWEDGRRTWSMAADGAGSNATNFAWVASATPTPGSINPNQTLIPWTDDDDVGNITIDEFSTTDTRISMVISAETNGLNLTPWYSTNLESGTWTLGANASQAATGNTYTVSCDLVTGVSGAFYKVTTE